MAIPDDFIKRMIAAIGEGGVLSDAADIAPFEREERGLLDSACDLVVRPRNSAEVAAIMSLSAAENVPVIPMGGNTGLVGGGVADGGIILSTGRMNKIIDIDALNHTMIVEAGCILATIQAAAAEVDCLFPLSLGAEGSCQIGGNLATNAGGVGVLRYGNMRDLVLGLEVVLPSGEIWSGLNALRKDNTGYDLKQLFIGAEGTLGIITKAVLKLFPLPRTQVTVLAALDTNDHVLELFSRTRAACGDRLTAFELIPRIGLELGVKHIEGVRDPFEGPHGCYALVQLSSPRENDQLRGEFESVLERALEDGIVEDAVFADSEAQSLELWKIREEIPAAQSREGGSIKHDIAVPVSKSADFIKEATERVEAALPGIRVCAFGHIGDGNIHFNLTQPVGADKAEFIARWAEFNRIVHDLVVEMDGSISAEHGIGLIKRDELRHYKSETELDLMRRVKQAIDPQGIMNPGKIFTT